MHSAPAVIVNQLGFRPGHALKRVLVPDVPQARSIFGDALFSVFEQNRFSMEPLNSPLQHEYVHRAEMKRIHTDLGTWLVGDFAHLRNNGVYQAWCGNTPSPAFVIRDDVYLRLIPDCIRYFQVQSCGRAVPGWHDACHLDDGYIPELNLHLNAAGGWHDAGDFRKWVSSTSMNAISLLLAHRMWGGREAQLGIEKGIFLREALQGVHFFLGVQDPSTGRLYQNIGGGRRSIHDNEDNRYTDNIPASGDERRIHPTHFASAPKCTTLFALYAHALRSTDAGLASRCLEAAVKSHAADRALARDDDSLETLQWRAWAAVELHRVTGEARWCEEAVTNTGRILALQECHHIGGQRQTRGFFWRAPGADSSHRKHVGGEYVIWVLAELIEQWPDHPDAPRWLEAIRLWTDEFALYFAGRNPFGLLPYGLYRSIPEDHPHAYFRPLGDGLFFRYFMASANFGTNARCSLGAVAFAAAARVLRRPRLVDHGYHLLEWTLGNNPYQVCTMNGGVGVTQPSALSFQMGNIPGGVTIGIRGDEQDQPMYAHPWSCTDEYYGYQTSQFLWALLALQAAPAE
jgi:hypothetical protein